MRNVLTVFLGSPSDLADERKKTSDVVAEINEGIKTIGWFIDVLGWEDTLPGFGRPQALINRDVERCDLFVGLLWRRWGSPPSVDSHFTSGFEEEFAIARRRRELSPTPEIWMFFKTVESAQMADAGAQLQRVVAFRDQLVANKTVLFKEFDTVDDWERVLRRSLWRHVLDIANIKSGVPEGPSEQAASPVRDISTVAAVASISSTGSQFSEVARFLAPAVETGNLDKVVAGAGNRIDLTFLAVRTLLLSAALIAKSGSSEMLLPTHELHTLYRYRERLQATAEEFYVVLKTILADGFDINPGWYWLRAHDSHWLIDALVYIALFDGNTRVRVNSFEILRQTGVSIFRVRDLAVERTLLEIPSDLHDAVWGYLVDVATQENVEILRESARDTWLEARVEWLRAWAATGRDLNEFLPKITDPRLISEPMKQLILTDLSRLTDASLEALRSMPILELSKAAGAELRTRGLPIDDGDQTSRTARHVMTLASSLGGIPAGHSFEAKAIETDEQRYERLTVESSDRLRLSALWYELDGPTSYRLLVERGEIARDTVRRDLLERFQRIYNESFRQFETLAGGEYGAKFREEFESYRDFVTGRFTTEALAALADEPTREDVVVARQFLYDNEARPAALRIVAARGDSTDVKDLIDIARSTFGDQRRLALGAVQRLAVDKLETARTLMASEVRVLRRAALSLILAVRNEDAIPFFEDILSDADESTRIGAVAQLWKRVDRGRLAEVLRRYLDRSTYFYNVVVWLDRMLYTSPPLLGYYETALDRKLQAQND
jgi:hypothetical protein